jgi:hypothetical protein
MGIFSCTPAAVTLCGIGIWLLFTRICLLLDPMNLLRLQEIKKTFDPKLLLAPSIKQSIYQDSGIVGLQMDYISVG